jgi:hypothetical protein
MINLVGQRLVFHPHHLNIFLGKGQKEFTGATGGHRPGYARSYFPHHGIGQDNANGPNDHIGLPEGNHYGVLASGAPVCVGFHHLGGGDGIGAQGQNLQGLPVLFLQAADHQSADSPALPVDYANSQRFTSA